MAPKPLPDTAYLRECFAFDPETGALTWRHRPVTHFQTETAWKTWNARFPGRVCGRRLKNDRSQVGLNGSRFFVHRIIWKLTTDKEPLEIDHRSRKPTGNTLDNLREATRRENTQNRSVHINNKSGLKGVAFHRRDKKYTAQITVNGKQLWLGYHSTKEEAHKAYCDAAKEHFGEFWTDGS